MLSGGGTNTARYQQHCYLHNHITKYCRHSKTKEKESNGKSSQKNTSVNSQVTTKPTEDNSDINHLSDPQIFLFSDSDSNMDTVRVDDKGNKSQYVSVQVQDAPTSGIINSGADITIMGGKLFKKVAAVARLKKCDFKKAKPCASNL